MHTFQLFVSSPGGAAVERRRTQNVVSRLNGEFAGREALAIAEKLAALDAGNARARSDLEWVRARIAEMSE